MDEPWHSLGMRQLLTNHYIVFNIVDNIQNNIVFYFSRVK